MNKLGVSTGIFYKHFAEEEMDKMISYLRDKDVDLIELLFARPRMINLEFCEENIEFLNQKEVVIHAPFFQDIGYEDVQLTTEIIMALISKADKLNCKKIILHADLIQDWDIIDKHPDVFLLENLKSERTYDLKKLQDLTKKHSFGIAFDHGHLKDSTHELLSLARELSPKIEEVQLSIKEDYEQFLSGNISSKYDFIKEFKKPVVLETRPKHLSDLPLIIKNIRSWLNS